MEPNFQLKPREYISSRKEMNRRKRAFINLSSSFFISLCIFSTDAIILLPQILVPAYIIVATSLILLIARLNKTLDNQACLQICLSDNELEWRFISSSDNCKLTDIRSIRIKRNIKGFIREIRIGTYGMKYLYINGLEDFEKFLDDLISSTKNVKLKEFKELINFDHPLFYLCLGTIFGILITSFFRLIQYIGENNIKYIQFSIACFLILTGMFFVLNKPVRGRYGNKNIIADFICGFLFLAIGVLIIICSKVFPLL